MNKRDQSNEDFGIGRLRSLNARIVGSLAFVDDHETVGTFDGHAGVECRVRGSRSVGPHLDSVLTATFLTGSRTDRPGRRRRAALFALGRVALARRR